MRNIISLIVFITIVLLIAGVSSAVTIPAVHGWYQTLNKPYFSPPDYVFGPVWTVLYIMIAVSGWIIWNKLTDDFSKKIRRAPMRVYAEQLLANFLWSFLFFGLHATKFALADIYIMLGLIALNIWHFKRINTTAAYLLVPYILWVAFASMLNFEIVALN